MNKIDKLFIRNPVEPTQDSVHFQALSWYAYDSHIENDDELVDGEIVEKLEYNIYIFGVNEKNESVTLKVNGFTPYFYVEVPSSFTPSNVKSLYEGVKKKLGKEEYGLTGYGIVHKKKLYPYLAGRKFQFMKLTFKTDKAFIKCKYMFSESNQEKFKIFVSGINTRIYEAFETNVPHINRFCHVRDIEPAGWVSVKKYTENIDNQGTQINIIAESKDIEGDYATKNIAAFTILSYDLECLPENTEEFPNPDLPNDIICQIGVVLCKYGTGVVQKIVFTNRPCNPIEDAVVFACKDEKDLLIKYCKLFKQVDPDKVIGYNTWGFDDNYLWKRLRLHDINTSCFTRITEVPPTRNVKELTSSAYGNNEFTYIACPGRETFDMLVAIRRDHKFESLTISSTGLTLECVT